MRNITSVSDFLNNWYPNIITYQDTDCLFESNMTETEKEYYKGVLNKIFGNYKRRNKTMTENELRDLIARTAEEDAKSGKIYEWSPELQALIDLYNRQPDIGRGIKYAPSLGGWCMLYISTLFVRNEMPKAIQLEIGAYEPMKNAKLSGQWRKNDGVYMPRRGDIIHYAYPRTSEAGKEFTQFHVGMITNSGSDQYGRNVIYSTEGNVENRVVMRAAFNWENNEQIDGFIVPDYKRYATSEIIIPELPKEKGVYILTAEIDDENTIEWRKEK